jgi:hypothetical protein
MLDLNRDAIAEYRVKSVDPVSITFNQGQTWLLMSDAGGGYYTISICGPNYNGSAEYVVVSRFTEPYARNRSHGVFPTEPIRLKAESPVEPPTGIDLSAYAKKSELPDFGTFATDADVAAAIASIPSGGGVLNILDGEPITLGDAANGTVWEGYATAETVVNGVAILAGSALYAVRVGGQWLHKVVSGLTTFNTVDPDPPTVVTPVAPTFTDDDGTSGDTYTVPSVTGVIYRIGLEVLDAGTYPATGTVTITAEAGVGYALAAGVENSWTWTFSAATGAAWGLWESYSFDVPDGTPASAAPGVNGRSLTVSGYDVVSGGRVRMPGNNSSQLTMPGPGTVPVQISVDYDLSDIQSGYEPEVRITIPVSSGTFNWKLQNSNNYEARPRFVWDYADVQPTITYEAGFAAGMAPWPASVPKTGTLRLELDPSAMVARGYISDVLIATADLSTWTYAAQQQRAFVNEVTIKPLGPYAAIDNFSVEAYR